MGHSMNILTLRAGLSFKWLIFFVSVSYIDYYYDFTYFYLLFRNYLIYLFRFKYARFLMLRNIVFSSIRIGQNIVGSVCVRLYVYDRVFIRMYYLLFKFKKFLKVKLRRVLNLYQMRKTLKKKRKWRFKTYKWYYFRNYNFRGKPWVFRNFHKNRYKQYENQMDNSFARFAERKGYYLSNFMKMKDKNKSKLKNFRLFKLFNRDLTFVNYSFINKFVMFRRFLHYFVTCGFFYPQEQFLTVRDSINLCALLRFLYLYKRFYLYFRYIKYYKDKRVLLLFKNFLGKDKFNKFFKAKKGEYKKKFLKFFLSKYVFFNSNIFFKKLKKKNKRKEFNIENSLKEKKKELFYLYKTNPRLYDVQLDFLRLKLFRKKLFLKKAVRVDKNNRVLNDLKDFSRKLPFWYKIFLVFYKDCLFRFYAYFYSFKNRDRLFNRYYVKRRIVNNYFSKLCFLKKSKRKLVKRSKKVFYTVSNLFLSKFLNNGIRTVLSKLPQFYRRNKKILNFIKIIYNFLFRGFFFKFFFIKENNDFKLNFKFMFLIFYVYMTRRFVKVINLISRLKKSKKFIKKYNRLCRRYEKRKGFKRLKKKLERYTRLLNLTVPKQYILFLKKKGKYNYMYLFGIFIRSFFFNSRCRGRFHKLLKYFYVLLHQWFWFINMIRMFKRFYMDLYVGFRKVFYYKVLLFFKKLNLSFNCKFKNFLIYPNSLLTLSGELFLMYVKWKMARRFTLNQTVWPFIRHLKNVNFWFIRGFFFKGSGRFTRRQRAVVNKYFYGQILFSTYNVRLYYYYIFIVTRHGKCGLKLWLNFNNQSFFRNFNKVYKISVL